jgi:hypothetical protein
MKRKPKMKVDYRFYDWCKRNEIEHPTLNAWAEFVKETGGLENDN